MAANPVAERPDGNWVHFLRPSALGDLKGSASLLGQEATSYLELRRARGLAPSV